jgi:hypothetical protein
MKAQIVTLGTEQVVGHLDAGASVINGIRPGDVVNTRSGQYVVRDIRRSHTVMGDNSLLVEVQIMVASG